MQGIVRDDKNMNRSLSPQNKEEDAQKDRKIKRLTLINRELIETLKQQNDELTKKISKQRLKGSRSIGKSIPKETKDLQSIRKELSNAYKQIDMYKNIVQSLKTKEVSLDNVDKIYQLQNKVKVEDAAIENLHKEIKYLATMREKQQKQIKMFENDDMKEAKTALEKQITDSKQKIKNYKKNSNKREQVQKRQHAYYVQLQKALRKVNDEYYPGKIERKQIKQNDDQIHENQWLSVKNKVNELRTLYKQNNKKLDLINRQKLRELKSFQENQLKLKQKIRKLNTLKSRIAELAKLTIIKQSKEVKEQSKLQPLPKREEFNKNDKNKEERQVKKWNVPEGFCLEKGKVLPNSSFFSDKNIIGNQHKYKIVEVNVWTDGYGIPCLLKFIYEDQQQQLVEGKQMADNIPQTLQMQSFQLKQKDYLWHISGKFSHGILISLTLKSKLGQQATYCDENSSQPGDPFNFFSQPNQIPSCFFGATIQPNQNTLKICYLGCEFMSDW